MCSVAARWPSANCTALSLPLPCIGMAMLSAIHLQAVDLQAGERPRAPLLAAFAAAYHDFAKRIVTEDTSSDLGRHLADITNYRLTIYAVRSRDRFVVEIPLPLEGRRLRGGGGKYEVDAKSMKILVFERYR